MRHLNLRHPYQKFHNEPLFDVHVERENVYIAGVKVGFTFRDPDEPGKLFMELPGVVCKQFDDRNELYIWLLKHGERIFPQARQRAIANARPYPQRLTELRRVA